jgi:hypothetical protein
MIVVLTLQETQFRKALSVRVSHSFATGSAVFDDEHLVSYAGLVPVMTLAEQTGRGGGRVCPTWRAVFVSDDPERGDRAGDRRHRRRRLDTGALSRRGIDPDTGEWISDAEVAEIPYTAAQVVASR